MYMKEGGERGHGCEGEGVAGEREGYVYEEGG